MINRTIWEIQYHIIHEINGETNIIMTRFAEIGAAGLKEAKKIFRRTHPASKIVKIRIKRNK